LDHTTNVIAANRAVTKKEANRQASDISSEVMSDAFRGREVAKGRMRPGGGGKRKQRTYWRT